MIIEEKFPSNLEAVPQYLDKLLTQIKPFVAEQDVFNVRLCLEEALVNAVKHGNKYDPGLFVKVKIETRPDILSIAVLDEGEGYDYKMIPNPTHSDNLHKPHGRGVFLIKEIMDKVEFFDCGRGIKMIKFLNRGQEA